MKTFYTIVILTLAAGFGCSESNSRQQNEVGEPLAEQQTTVLKDIDTKTLKTMLADQENLQVLDVRTPGEVEAGTIGDPVVINFQDSDFRSQLSKLDKDKPVVVYCAAGGRSAKAADLMHEAGFKEVYNYTEGYRGWAAAQ